jgi:Tol biopolymer transport system component
VTATGTSLSYQWKRSSDGGSSFADIAAATNATLNLTAVPLGDNGHQFHVVISNSTGSLTSNAATLTVNAAQAAPVFTTQPVSASIIAGQSTQFTVAVTGAPAPTLQWQLSTDNGGSWNDINGATGSVLEVLNAALANNGRQFRAVATNSVDTVISSVVILTVTAAAGTPAFTMQPVDVTVTEGQNAQFTVAVSGTPAPTLQWQVSTDNGVNWSNINGETGTTITVAAPPLADSGRKYRAVASNSEGNVTSSAALLTVNAPSASLKVVFTRGYGIESGKDDLYLIKEDGTGEVALATTADNEFFSAMAPGGRIVYQRTAGGQLDLYSVNSGGTDLQILANTPDGEIFSGITTSGRVIYRRDTAAGGRDMWSVNADGSNPQVLASSANHEDFSGITSSGKVIYSVPQYSGNDLYIINADGTSNTALATEPYYYKSFMGETPSGQIILDMDNGYGTGLSGIYSISAGGSATALTSNTVAGEYGFAGITSTGQVVINRNVAGQRDLYGNGTVSLATSADYEVYAGSTAAGQVIYSKLTTTQHDLYIVNADGSNTRQLTDATGDDYFAALTPDGRVIYGKITAGLYDIYMVNADGTGTVPVAFSADYEEYQGMTSDGRVIYERTTSNVTYLYAYNTNNNVTTPLATSGGHAFFVDITPNGKVLFRRQSGNADLYIINPDGTGMQALANTGNNEFFNAAFQ